MIVLKILLWIFLAVLALILLVMILPVSVRVGYVDKKVIIKVKYAFLNVFELGGRGIVNRFMGGSKKSEAPESDNRAKDTATGASVEEPKKPAAANDFTPVGDNAESIADKPEQAADPVRQNSENAEKSTQKANTVKSVLKEDDSDFGDDESEDKKQGKSLGEKIDFVHDIWHAAGRPALKIFKGFKFSEFYVDFLIADPDAYKCALNYGRISGALYYVLGWFGVLFNMKYKTVDVNPGFDMKESRWDVSFKLSFNIMNVVIAGLWFLVTYIFRILIPSKRMKKKIKNLYS